MSILQYACECNACHAAWTQQHLLHPTLHWSNVIGMHTRMTTCWYKMHASGIRSKTMHARDMPSNKLAKHFVSQQTGRIGLQPETIRQKATTWQIYSTCAGISSVQSTLHCTITIAVALGADCQALQGKLSLLIIVNKYFLYLLFSLLSHLLSTSHFVQQSNADIEIPKLLLRTQPSVAQTVQAACLWNANTLLYNKCYSMPLAIIAKSLLALSFG